MRVDIGLLSGRRNGVRRSAAELIGVHGLTSYILFRQDYGGPVGFGGDVDYAMLMKLYGPTVTAPGRYSPAECIGAIKTPIEGKPAKRGPYKKRAA